MSAVIDLAALPPVMVVPGIAAWLGRPQPEPEPADSFGVYLERLSQKGDSHA